MRAVNGRSMHMAIDVGYLTAVGAGAISFLSPCVLPLVPPYLCYMAGVSVDDFQLFSGKPKGFGYVAQSGKKLVRNFCVECGSRLYTSDLESFPGMVFVQIGALDDPKGIAPQLEMFTKRRLDWAKPLGLPQFTDMPH